LTRWSTSYNQGMLDGNLARAAETKTAAQETAEAFATRLRNECSNTACVAVYQQGRDKKIHALHASGGIVLADAITDIHATDAITPLTFIPVDSAFFGKVHSDQIHDVKAELAKLDIITGRLDIEYA